MPYLQRVNFPLSPNGDEPTRYQVLTLDLRNLALVPALSIRFGSDFRVGFAPGFLFSTGRLMFAEDLALDGGTAGLAATACPASPAAPRTRARPPATTSSSGHGFGDAKFSVTLGGGHLLPPALVRVRPRLPEPPAGQRRLRRRGRRASTPTVTLPPRDRRRRAARSPARRAVDRCVFGDISYRLPDVWIAGATWRLRPGLELTAMVRWLWLHVHDRIDVRLSGPPLDTGHELPQHVVLYRGFKDVWDTRVRVSYWWRERIRVGAMLRFETSAVDDRRRQRRRRSTASSCSRSG